MKEKFNRIIENIKSYITDPKNRHYIIGGAVVLAALAIILCSVLGKKEIENLDADCPYPYTFAANDRGATVTITGPFAEGAVWSVENSDTDVISVSIRRQNQKKAVFDIRPVSQGNARTAFRLKEPNSDYPFDIYIDLFVDPENNINIIGSSHYDRAPEFMPVSGTDAEYAVTYDDTDRMHVLLRSDEAPGWVAETLNPEVFDTCRVTEFEAINTVSSADVVSGSEPAPIEYVDTGFVEFEVYGYCEGAGLLRFSNTVTGAELELYVCVDTIGTVSCITEQIFNELEAERLLEQAEAEAAAEAGVEPDYYSADYFDDMNDQFIDSLIEQQAAEQAAEQQPAEQIAEPETEQSPVSVSDEQPVVE